MAPPSIWLSVCVFAVMGTGSTHTDSHAAHPHEQAEGMNLYDAHDAAIWLAGTSRERQLIML